jgi:hypothetical protein
MLAPQYQMVSQNALRAMLRRKARISLRSGRGHQRLSRGSCDAVAESLKYPRNPTRPQIETQTVGQCHDRTSQRRDAVEPRPNDDYDQKMRRLLVILSLVFLMPMLSAQAQPALTVDPESIVPLPDKFDLETPAPAVPLEIARFQGAWIGTWQDDRHILVVERVRPDGHVHVVFARSDSAFYGMNREWWRDDATVAGGVLTMTGFRPPH